MVNKKKVINDPVYGFVTIHSDLIAQVIQHPFFQRLRRINQLGLTSFVYPGAVHTRFHHALGAMHLMSLALESLRSKGHDINESEYEAALIAILLHDLGHGPFSHLLEHSLLHNTSHESVSLLLMRKINAALDGKLDLAVKIFEGSYNRKFFNQLVSSQLDIDRLDYLNRDAYFTGVSEGTVGAERIIKMLDVHNDQIVVEEKGIYSVENFLNTRRFMYWQIYFHKATISAEVMLVELVKRASELIHQGKILQASNSLLYFLKNRPNHLDISSSDEVLNNFAKLDDYDIWTSIKLWADSDDFVLKDLSNRLLNRQLFKVELANEAFTNERINFVKNSLKKQYSLNDETLPYFLIEGEANNAAYVSNNQKIMVLMKDGKIQDIAEASELPNIKAISKIVKKFYLCYPKNVSL
ncbi:MAG: HD domain-containing protein [Opitutaceae bacterium]|nr:HD domain-containing protein [Cytophagales bacterium]